MMAMAFVALVGLGAFVVVVGGIWFIVSAFRTGVWWGLAVLFLSPPANLIFLIAHWKEARQAFMIQVLGAVLMAGAVGVAWSQGVSSPAGAEKLLPASLAEKVAGLDLPAGMPAAQPRPEEEAAQAGPSGPSYVGKTLSEVIETLGYPKARTSRGRKTILMYPDLELVSEDGRTIASQGKPQD
jgi:hypothetical protein